MAAKRSWTNMPAADGDDHANRFVERQRLHVRSLVSMILFLLVLTLPLPASVSAGDGSSLRLDPNVSPASQEITLNLDPMKPSYSGSTVIHLNVYKETKGFRFHAQGLKFTSVLLRSETGVITTRIDTAETGLVIILSSVPLKPGPYTLSIGFTNGYNTQTTSLFRVETGGEWYVFSQFETCDARKAFPCWDEPCYKIPYQVTLNIPESLTALSNTPIAHEATRQETRTVVFEPTSPLPSYLLAVAVGRLEFVPVPGTSIPSRIVTVKGATGLGGEAARCLPPLLGSLERFFGEKYPFSKLDLVAVPDFSGAMENAGAIFFDQPSILADSTTLTQQARSQIAGTMAHEMAHMWFGDLVTMAWWDDMWLNESFASWLGDKTTEEVFPEFRFAIRQVNRANVAMLTDASATTHPIRRKVSPDDDIQGSFDEIGYDKGQAVLGMFEQWLGPEQFRRGVVKYINARRGGNAVAADFMDALGKSAGVDLAGPLATFLDQPGVPLVSVRPLGGYRVEIAQKRFMNYGLQDSVNRMWKVPVVIRYPSGKSTSTFKFLLTRQKDTVSLPGSASMIWLHPNAGEIGYYRWSIPKPLPDTLFEYAQSLLSVRERLGLLHNLYATMNSGDLAGGEYLRALEMTASDQNILVVKGLLGGLGAVNSQFVEESDDLVGPFGEFVRKLLSPAFQRIGWKAVPGEDPLMSECRSGIIADLGFNAKDSAVIARADSLATAYLKDPRSVEPGLVGTVLWLTALYGDSVRYLAYRDRFETAEIPQDRRRFLSLLGVFTDSLVFKRGLNYTFSGPVRSSDLFGYLFPFAYNQRKANRELFVDWLKKNCDELASRLGDQSRYMVWMVAGISQDKDELAAKIFGHLMHTDAGVASEFQKMLDDHGRHRALRAREGASVKAYLMQSAKH